MKRLSRAQPDLFATARYQPDLVGLQRQRALELLKALLTEAISGASAAPPSTADVKEVGDDNGRP